MFSTRQKREIADALQKVLRSTNHPELPSDEIQFDLTVYGAEPWSWACIKNNGEVANPTPNLHNERQDPQSSSSPEAGEMSGSFVKLRALLRELDDLSYEMLDHPKAGKLCGLIEKLQEWGCSASEHDWHYDQCGYWQHQYCIECNAAKYPDLAKKSCGELDAEMGKMSEEEFLSNRDA